MEIRRIVTGRDRSGKSIFVSDASAPRSVRFEHVPGQAASLVWGTRPNPTLDHDTAEGTDPSVSARSWVPSEGGSTLMLVTFPPDSVMASPGFDPAAAGGEYMQLLPGLAEKFEVEHPGMHTTDTVDYAMLVEGELHLELDDGQTKKLSPRDVVVQNGTRHAWRNRSDKPATILFVLIGAKRA